MEYFMAPSRFGFILIMLGAISMGCSESEAAAAAGTVTVHYKSSPKSPTARWFTAPSVDAIKIPEDSFVEYVMVTLAADGSATVVASTMRSFDGTSEETYEFDAAGKLRRFEREESGWGDICGGVRTKVTVTVASDVAAQRVVDVARNVGDDGVSQPYGELQLSVGGCEPLDPLKGVRDPGWQPAWPTMAAVLVHVSNP
jgi:hypothetical protein